MSDNYKYIDLGYINKIADGNIKIIKRLLKSYIRSIPGYIKEMNMTFNSSSWHLLGNAAYRAKDIMPIVGLKQFALDLYDLDMLCREAKDVEAIKKLVDKFSIEGKEAVEEIKDALSKYEKTE